MRNLFWGIILVSFGTLFLLDNLGVADFGDVMHDFWPLILIIWGASILLRKKEIVPPASPTQTIPPFSPPPPPTSGSSGTYENELLHQSNVFGNIHVSVSSINFKGGSVSTVFGDCTIDLSKAEFAAGEHILRIHGVFGDSTVIIPKEAAVMVEASTTFGDIAGLGQARQGFSPSLMASTPNYATAEKRLKITVNRVFGDVRVS